MKQNDKTASARHTPRYTIVRAAATVPLTGSVASTPWERARPLTIGNFPWYKSGLKQSTVLRAMYDKRALYLQYRCRDVHSFSRATKTNGKVWLDSCVEFFATIEPDRRPHYFNLEMNCCGTLLMSFAAGRDKPKRISPKLAKKIQIVTSLPGPTKDESPSDRSWWLAAAVPFAVISELSGVSVHPRSGTIWRANAFRCGGKTDDQYACWSPIGTPNPDYHRPEFFGLMRFE